MGEVVDIKRLREHLEMSQEVFGALVGVSAKTLSRYERGLKEPSEKTLVKIKKLQRSYGIKSIKKGPFRKTASN